MEEHRAGNSTGKRGDALRLEPLLLSVEEAADVLRLGRSTQIEVHDGKSAGLRIDVLSEIGLCPNALCYIAVQLALRLLKEPLV